MQINIPLTEGDNYISFPENSSYTIGTILTDSGISSLIVAISTYDPIFANWKIIDPNTSFIEEGKGYYIKTTSNGTITYDGYPFSIQMTFEILKSSLMKGWNLVSTDTTTLAIPGWCRVIDTQTNFQVLQIEPTKAYWILYPDDCSTFWTTSFIIPVAISLIGVFILAYAAFGPEIRSYFQRRKTKKIAY